MMGASRLANRQPRPEWVTNTMSIYANVGIIGGGTMGSGIAYEVLRRTATQVILRDVNADALGRARTALERFIARPPARVKSRASKATPGWPVCATRRISPIWRRRRS